MTNKIKKLVIPIPSPFNFWNTAWSHGWVGLLPFKAYEEKRKLTRIFLLESGLVTKTIWSVGGASELHIRAEAKEELSESDLAEIEAKFRTCLRIDEDYRSFYELCDNDPKFRWVIEYGAGRILRCPSVYEDVVKTICTTNCSWRQTRVMVTNLVQKLGPTFDTDHYGFPPPKQLASISEEFIKQEIRAGYRSSYLLDFARHVANGELVPEKWKTCKLESLDLRKELLKIKGVGDYAATNILKLVGRFDYLTLDSWTRKKFAQKYRDGKKVSDKEIYEAYESYGQWKGLIFWLDMTREYLQPDET